MSQGGHGQQPPNPAGDPQPGHGQPQQPGWDQPNPGYTPRPTPPPSSPEGGSSEVAPTAGLIVAAIGALLLLASVFSMDFVVMKGGGFFGEPISQSFSFDDLRDAEEMGRVELSGRIGFYVKYTVVLAFIAIAASVGGSLFKPAAQAAVAVPTFFLFGHLSSAFMWDAVPGGSVGPALGAWVGAAGYAALAAAPLIRVPLDGGQSERTSPATYF